MTAANPARRLTFRLRLPCGPPGENVWGDFYFARSLAQALERRGHGVNFDFARKGLGLRWLVGRVAGKPADVDLILRGKVAYRRRRGRPAIMWLYSNADSVTDGELAAMDHVLVASRSHAARLAARGLTNVSEMLQCTDATLFSPDRARPDRATDCLFVGNRRDFDRPAVAYALRAGLPLAVWGRRWEGHLPDGVLRGRHIANEDLGSYYASARVVLNDHTPDMAANGFMSNRAYDVMASGAPLVTDLAAELPEDLAAGVYGFTDAESFRDAVARAMAEGAALRDRRRALADHVRREHSFDARARVIEGLAQAALSAPRAA